MARLAFVVPRELAATSVFGYVARSIAEYRDGGVQVDSVVLSSTQAKVLYDMECRYHSAQKLPETLLGLNLIIEKEPTDGNA